jgi:hypothetical protein
MRTFHPHHQRFLRNLSQYYYRTDPSILFQIEAFATRYLVVVVVVAIVTAKSLSNPLLLY